MNLGYHCDLVREALLECGFEECSITAAMAANCYTDFFHIKESDWVFDDDFFDSDLVERASKLHFSQLPNHFYVKQYMKSLLTSTYYALKRAFKDEKSEDDLVEAIIMIIGTTLHVTHDFFAHANWVEMDAAGKTGIKDATYFDVINQDSREGFEESLIKEVIDEYSKENMLRFGKDLKENDIFTTGSSNTCGEGNCPHWHPSDRVIDSRPDPEIDSTAPYYSKRPKEIKYCRADDRDVHSIKRPIHGKYDQDGFTGIRKDNNTNSYFPWTYRGAFKASLQWMEIIKSWVSDLYTYSGRYGNPSYGLPSSLWDKVKKYKGFEKTTFWGTFNGFDSDLSRIMNASLLIGVWKEPKSAEHLITEWNTFFEDDPYPYKGDLWKKYMYHITKHLFSFNGDYKFFAPLKSKFNDLADIEKPKMQDENGQLQDADYTEESKKLITFAIKHYDLERSIDLNNMLGWSNLADLYRTYWWCMEYIMFEYTHEAGKKRAYKWKTYNCSAFSRAVYWKKKELIEDYFGSNEETYNKIVEGAVVHAKDVQRRYNYKWLKISVPRCDTHDNAEDNDLYANVWIEGVKYQTSHYMDNDDPRPGWLILKPIKVNENGYTKDVSVKFQLKDNAPGDDYSDDGTMDISKYKTNLYFDYDLDNAAIHINAARVDPKDVHRTPNGFLIYAHGGSGVYVDVSAMTDKRIDFVTKTSDKENADTDNSVFAHIGPMVYPLDNREYNDFNNDVVDCFAFDPGYIEEEDFKMLTIHKNSLIGSEHNDDRWIIDYALAKFGSTIIGRDANDAIVEEGSVWYANVNDYYSIHNHHTKREYAQAIEHVTISLKTPYKKNAGTDSTVTIAFRSKTGRFLFSQKLDDILVNDREKGGYDFHYFNETRGRFNVNEIYSVEIEKHGDDKWLLQGLEIWINKRKLFHYNFGESYRAPFRTILYKQGHFLYDNSNGDKVMVTRWDTKPYVKKKTNKTGFGFGYFNPNVTIDA